MKIKKSLKTVLLLLIIGLAVSDVLALMPEEEGKQNQYGASFLFGSKSLKDSDWEPVDVHIQRGIELTYQPIQWNTSFVFRALFSEEETVRDVFLPSAGVIPVEFGGKTTELQVGVRKILVEDQILRPFFGFGPSFIMAEQTIESRNPFIVFIGETSPSDSNLGFYIEGGLYFIFRNSLSLGFHGIYSKADVKLFSETIEAGGVHFNGSVGFRF